MDRKTFIQKTTGAILLAAPAYVLLSCSSSSDDSNTNTPPPGGGNRDCLANGTNSSIGANHGHSISVPIADINAGVDKSYNISGTAGHAHSVAVTAANFDALRNNQSVEITSSSDTGDGHLHNVTIFCA